MTYVPLHSQKIKPEARKVKRAGNVPFVKSQSAMGRIYEYDKVFDSRKHFDYWILLRSLRQAYMSGRITGKANGNISRMDGSELPLIIAWLNVNRSEWERSGVEVNQDDIAKFINSHPDAFRNDELRDTE